MVSITNTRSRLKMSEQVQKPIRYNGFTCPKCGSHYFGTYVNRTGFDKNFPAEATISYCKENDYSHNGCDFKWNRDDKEINSQVMYQQTREEFLASLPDIS